MGQISVYTPEAGQNYVLNPSAEMAGNFAAINGAEMLTNGGFETAGATPPACTNWTESAVGGTITRTTTAGEYRSGSAGYKLNCTGAGNLFAYNNLTVIPGYFYQLTLYARGDGTNDGKYAVYDESNSAYIVSQTATGKTGTSYTTANTVTFTTPAGCTSIRVYVFGSAVVSSTVYFDDVSLVNIPFLTVADGRSTTYAYKGLYSYHINTAYDGAGISLQLGTAPASGDVSVGMMIRGALPANGLHVTAFGPNNYEAVASLWTDGDWTCYGKQDHNWMSSDTTLYIKQNGAGSCDIYIDCIHVNNKAYLDTYVDGDQNGCYWNGGVHQSTSGRNAQYRGGGKIVDIDATYGTQTTLVRGLGLPDPDVSSTPYAVLDGSEYRGTRIGERDFILTFAIRGSSAVNFHTIRNNLQALFDPYLVSPVQPVRFRYTGNTRPLEFDAYYVGGLEGSWRSGKIEYIPARFRATKPEIYGIQELAMAWTNKQSVTNTDYIARRIHGSGWDSLKSGGTGSVLCFAVGPDKCLYIGGSFTNWDGIATADYIVKYDPQTDTFASITTTTPADAAVRAMCFDRAGNLYIGGIFTGINGVANTKYIAKYSTSAGTWAAVGGGAGAGATATLGVCAITIDDNGYVVIGGDYSSWVGAGTYDRLTWWDGSTYVGGWTTGLVGGNIYALAMMPGNNIAIGGTVTSYGELTFRQWLTGKIISGAMGLTAGPVHNASSPTVYAFAVDYRGILYIGGDFTNWNDANGDYITSWTGSQYESLSTGLAGGAVKSLFHAPWSDYLLIGGAFTSAGGDSNQARYTTWKGTPQTGFFVKPDVTMPSVTVNAIIAINDNTGSVGYWGYDGVGPIIASMLNTFSTTANLSTAKSYPRIVINRSGGTSATLLSIRNETTGKVLNLNYAILDGETIEIDLQRKTASRIHYAYQKAVDFANDREYVPQGRLDILNQTALRSSDFATWFLQRGVNAITFYIADVGTPTITATMYVRPTHYSVDGGV